MLNQLITALKKNLILQNLIKMAENASPLKRQADSEELAAVPAKVSKKGKNKNKQRVASLGQSEGFKRKISLLVSYNGSGYYGVQVNGDFPTIEKDLFAALVSIGAIPQDHSDTPSKMWFQRGSRTDKGVSAVGQVFSLKAVLIPDFVNKVNAALPQKIKVMGFIRTTNGFDAKNFCCGRTYTYMAPTFAFAPIEKFITDEFRVNPLVIDRVRGVLKKFLGTHKFHNFTSGVKPDQASAARYITGFECSDPYVRDGIEFVTITVKGQSFMLHQIRKMIGITIAVVRGFCGEETIDKCWGPDKVDVPKAPGLGLVLEELHFDGYNKKFGCDGIHEKLDWTPFREEMAKFKEKYIISDIVAQEKADRSMFNWMRTLQFHNFAEPRLDGPERPWNYAFKTTLAKDSPVIPSEDSNALLDSQQNQQSVNSKTGESETTSNQLQNDKGAVTTELSNSDGNDIQKTEPNPQFKTDSKSKCSDQEMILSPQIPEIDANSVLSEQKQESSLSSLPSCYKSDASS